MNMLVGRSMERIFKVFSALMLSVVCGSVAARADAVLDWNTIAVNTSVANKHSPFAQAREAAIVQLAVFEAVNAISREYQPYLGTITASRGASAEAAAIEAAYSVLVNYFPASKPALDADWKASMGAIPNGQAMTEGIAAGDEAASAMMALRLHDGSSPAEFKVPGLPVPGEWQATPSCPVVNGIQQGTQYQWQNVVPFGVSSVRDFLLAPPPALATEKYADTYNEVMRVGSLNSTARPADRANVALFYAVTSPSQVFNQAARQVATEKGRSLAENAHDLALINMAISDSIVAAFFNKYHYNFWRPETAIHAGNADGNPETEGDPSWVPFITTPCFPSYPSNHGTSANSAAEVMRHLYGEGGHTITLTNPVVPTIVLPYTSFDEITDDISDARVYGGIHFRTDQDAGAKLGRAVGAAVYKSNLRPVDE